MGVLERGGTEEDAAGERAMVGGRGNVRAIHIVVTPDCGEDRLCEGAVEADVLGGLGCAGAEETVAKIADALSGAAFYASVADVE